MCRAATRRVRRRSSSSRHRRRPDVQDASTTLRLSSARKTSAGSSPRNPLCTFGGSSRGPGTGVAPRSWFSEVKSAFVRDQAPDSEKCLVFGDLLTGPARNWCRHLSRSTRSDGKGLAKSFQIQYCGRGVSVARQYYHARKRSDESPLEYLYRLNVDGLRAQLSITAGSTEARREHVDHFIETLDDRDLANQLALLRIPDADTLEETL
ncbi:unnamed protein product [Phytophthora fragariaefolia]|uniref:Unnamed protein product n=1 Tax=Phytophthora fragariaefolia TaxID=1490495 RepID=A0A9W6YHW6_9STRA|nr:unnamed protein product [Phytophthora fragariaefolia]